MAVYLSLLTVLFYVTYVKTTGLKEEFSWTRMTFQWPEDQLSSRAAFKYVNVNLYKSFYLVKHKFSIFIYVVF